MESTRSTLLIYFIPAVSLLAYWVAGEAGLISAALVFPMLAGGLSLMRHDADPTRNKGGAARLIGTEGFGRLATTELETCRTEGRKSAVFMVRFDDFDQLVERHGQGAADSVMEQAALRLRSTLRSDDILGGLGADGFAICLAAQPALDLEICLQLSGRFSASLEEPFAVDGVSIYASACLGFCQLGRETARTVLKNDVPLPQSKRDPVVSCAEIALEAARTHAPAAIRAYAPEMKARRVPAASSNQNVVMALESGEIVPWFQPQISTDTGRITGFECLARWVDPERGPVSPAEFLPQLEAANKMPRLLEVILYHGLIAAKAWDEAGLDVQHVGVNFSSVELSDPGLVDKVRWELDRFELSPDRLAVEILETVVAQGPDDVITRNIKGLADMGCQIDLDDFGTGHASLASIRRFSVGRIKIDRSFVMKSDRDPEQQRMIKAILTMAERLDMETLAEGVETVGEHALLAQLGCTHVQGFGIARPMPFDQTVEWIRAHNAKLEDTPKIGRSAR